MSLKQQLKEDVIAAMKGKDSETLTVLRMAQSAINTKEKEKRYALAKDNPEETEEVLNEKSLLTDDELISVITSEIKKRKDAMALYEQGGRPELVESEKKEMTILQKYLPEQLSAEELQKLIEASVAKVGATEMKDMGKVMADLAPSIKGKADNSEVSKIIKEMLSK